MALKTKMRNSFNLSRKERINVTINFKEVHIMSMKKKKQNNGTDDQNEVIST